jgi:hypothetical protein
MARRSTPQSKTDDLAFPVRVKIAVPGSGLGGPGCEMHVWLAAQLGPGEYAVHAAQSIGSNAMAVYFRSADAAQRFVAAFPDLALADGTLSPAYTSPALSGRAVRLASD